MSRLRLAAIVLLVAGAGLFAVGTSTERTHHHNEVAETSPVVHGTPPGEGGESAEHRATEASAAHSDGGAPREAKILGINRESTAVVVAAVLASLALAVLLWQRPSRAAWLVVAVAAAAFALFDIAEVLHQVDAAQTAPTVIAGLVALAHAGVVAIATNSLRPAKAPR